MSNKRRNAKRSQNEASQARLIRNMKGVVFIAATIASSLNVADTVNKKHEKAFVKEIIRDNPQMSEDEAKMFVYAQNGHSGLLKKHLKSHGDLDVNKPDKDGNTILMIAFLNRDVVTLNTLLRDYGDKFDYHQRNNAGVGYQDILEDLEKRLENDKDPTDRVLAKGVITQLEENIAKQQQEEATGQVRSDTSYAIYEMMQSKTR